MSSEVWVLNADQPGQAFTLFQPRLKDVLYYVNHANDLFYIHTNKEAKNFKIMTCAEGSTSVKDWKEILPHNDKILVQGFDVFKNYLVISERKNGLTQVHIINTNDKSSHYLAFDEPAYTAGFGYTPDFNSEVLRFNYTSLTTPSTVYDYHMGTRQKKLMKQMEVIGTFKQGDYIT